MEIVSYSVNDLSADQRHVFEGVLGKPLRDDQQVILQLVDSKAATSNIPAPPPIQPQTNQSIDVGILPDWCSVLADMSDEEFADVEDAILTRADLTRSIETGE
jgi:hypothetical protein